MLYITYCIYIYIYSDSLCLKKCQFVPIFTIYPVLHSDSNLNSGQIPASN